MSLLRSLASGAASLQLRTVGLLMLVLLLALSTVDCTAAAADSGSVVPGANWTDVSGASIQAHAPGLLADPHSADGVWWCGESEKTSDLSAHGINCYYSADFLGGSMAGWQSVGMVLNQAAVFVPGHTGPFTLERPKLLFHAGSGMYVLWFHIDDGSYSVRRVGVAVSRDVKSGFSFVRSFQPDGLPSLDMSVFADYRDGQLVAAYFIRSVDNSYVGVSRIADDFMDTTGLCSIIPEAREGHAVFYHPQFDRYFMLTSHLTGWAPNAMEAFISSTNRLEGTEWISVGNPTGSSTSFDSQPALVWPYTSTTTNTSYFIYLGDRWAAPNLLNASYIWLPITVRANRSLSIPFRAQWQLDDPFNNKQQTSEQQQQEQDGDEAGQAEEAHTAAGAGAAGAGAGAAAGMAVDEVQEGKARRSSVLGRLPSANQRRAPRVL